MPVNVAFFISRKYESVPVVKSRKIVCIRLLFKNKEQRNLSE